MDNLRVATAEERDFYYKTLYPLQDFVFSLLKGEPDIYLTGGTALARFYFQHHLSEDIDLFIKVAPEDSPETIASDRKTDIYARDLAGRLVRGLGSKFGSKCDIVNEHYGDMYSRFFIQTDILSLKIDFVREYSHIGATIPQPSGINLNNLEDMGASKISAFEDRAEIKDIIDLFYFTQQIPLPRLFELADLKRVPVPYEHLLTINIQGISGIALLEQTVDTAEVMDFIDLLKHETAQEVKKKRN